MEVDLQQSYAGITGQSYIETDYSVNDLKLFILKLTNYEPSLIPLILSFIIHLDRRNGYYINSFVCLLTGINITKLDMSYYPNYSNNVVCNRTIKKFENIKKIIDKVIEWYENCYVFEKYDKIIESRQYSIKKNKKLLELMMDCNSYEDKLKLFNFNEKYDHYTLLVLQKRIPSIKLFAEFIKNNLPTIKFNKKYKKPKKQTINIDIEEEDVIIETEEEEEEVIVEQHYDSFIIEKVIETIKLKKRNEKYLFKKKKYFWLRFSKSYSSNKKMHL
jgi:hypothetical protein